MAKPLNIIVQAKLADGAKKAIQSEIGTITGSINIGLKNSEQLQQTLKKVKELEATVKQLQNMKFDASSLTTGTQQVAENLKKTNQSIKESVENVSKFSQAYKQATGGSQQLTQQTKELNVGLGQTKKIIEEMATVDNKSTVVSTKMISTINLKDTYKEISKLLKEENDIKLKMIGVDQNQARELQTQLNIIKAQKQTLGQALSQQKALLMSEGIKANDTTEIKAQALLKAKLSSDLAIADMNYQTRIKTARLEAIRQEQIEREKSLQYEQKVNYAIAKQKQDALHAEALEMNRQFDLKKQHQEYEQKRVSTLGTRTVSTYSAQEKDLRAMATQFAGTQEIISTKFIPTVDRAGNTINKLQYTVRSGAQELKSYTLSADETTQAIYQLEGATRQASGKDMGFLGQLGVAFERFPIWIAASTAVMGTIHQFQQGVTYIKDMDTAMTELNKVVDFSKEQMEGMRKSALDLGTALGHSSVDVMKSMAEFGRVTKNMTEIQELAKTATMASNVTSLSAQDAAKALNSTIISFGMSAKDSMKILDQWNEIQNNFRTSAEDLAGAIGTVGAAAKLTGTSLTSLEGYVTAIVSATGISGDEAGTAIKGVMSRIYRIGAEGADDAGKTEELLNSMGIAVRKSATEFRGMSNILDDVHNKWGTLTSTQKSALAQQIAGTYHYSKFISLMDNYGISIDATNKAMNSQGSASQENEKFIASLEGKLGKLKIALETLYSTLVSSDFLKALVDGLTGFVSGISQVIGFLQNLDLSFLKMITTSKVFLSVLMGVISGFVAFKTVMLIIPLITAVASALRILTGSYAGVRIAIISATKAQLIWNAILAINPWILGATALVGLIATIGSYVYMTGKATQAVAEKNEVDEQALQIYSDSTKKAQEEIKTSDDLVDSYETLASKTKLTTGEKSKLKTIQEQLIKIYPQLKGHIDNEKSSLIENIKAVKDLSKAEQDRLVQKLEAERVLAQASVSIARADFNGASYNVDYYAKTKKDAEYKLAHPEKYLNSFDYNTYANSMSLMGKDVLEGDFNITDEKSKAETFKKVANMQLQYASQHLVQENQFYDKAKSILDQQTANDEFLSKLKSGQLGSGKEEDGSYIGGGGGGTNAENYQDRLYLGNAKINEQIDDIVNKAKATQALVDSFQTGIEKADNNNDIAEKIKQEENLNKALNDRASIYKTIASQLSVLQGDTNKKLHSTFDSILGKDFKGTKDLTQLSEFQLASFKDSLQGKSVSIENAIGHLDSGNKGNIPQIQKLKQQQDYYQNLIKLFDEYTQGIVKMKDARVNALKEEFDAEQKALKALSTMNSDKMDRFAKILDNSLHPLNVEMEKLDAQESALADNDYDKKVDILNKKILVQKAIYEEENAKLWELQNATKGVDTSSKKYTDTLEQLTLAKMKDATITAQLTQQLNELIAKGALEKLEIIEDTEEQIADAIKQGVEDKKKAYDDEYKAFEDATQKKLKLLDERNDTEDYKDDVSKQNQTITDLEKKRNELQLDDSAQAKIKLIEIDKELSDERDKLTDLQTKRRRDLVKQGLQDQLDDKKDSIDKEKDDLDKNFTDEMIAEEAHNAILNNEFSNKVEALGGIFATVEGKVVTIQEAYAKFLRESGNGTTDLAKKIDEFNIKLGQTKDLIGNLDILVQQSKMGSAPTGSNSQSQTSPIDQHVDFTNKDGSTVKVYDMAKMEDYLGNKYIASHSIQGSSEYQKAAKENAQIRSGWGVDQDTFNYDQLKKKLEALGLSFKDGGLIDYTGLASVHGTKQRPEVMFDFDDATKLFNAFKVITPITQNLMRLSTPSAVGAGGMTFNFDVNIEGDATPESIASIKKAMTDSAEIIKRKLNEIGITKKVK